MNNGLKSQTVRILRFCKSSQVRDLAYKVPVNGIRILNEVVSIYQPLQEPSFPGFLSEEK